MSFQLSQTKTPPKESNTSFLQSSTTSFMPEGSVASSMTSISYLSSGPSSPKQGRGGGSTTRPSTLLSRSSFLMNSLDNPGSTVDIIGSPDDPRKLTIMGTDEGRNRFELLGDYVPYHESLRAVYMKAVVPIAGAAILAFLPMWNHFPWLAYSVIHEGFTFEQESRKSVKVFMYYECATDEYLGISEKCEDIDDGKGWLMLSRVLLMSAATVTVPSFLMALLQFLVVAGMEVKQMITFPPRIRAIDWGFWAGLAALAAGALQVAALVTLKTSYGGSGGYAFLMTLASSYLLVLGAGYAIYAEIFYNNDMDKRCRPKNVPVAFEYTVDYTNDE